MFAQVVWEAPSQRISMDFRFEHGKPDPHKTPPVAVFRKGRPFRKESTRSSEETSKKYENRLKNRPEERTRSQRRKTSKIGLRIDRKSSKIDARTLSGGLQERLLALGAARSSLAVRRGAIRGGSGAQATRPGRSGRLTPVLAGNGVSQTRWATSL